MDPVKVEVTVIENGVEVDHRVVTYYPGQEYAVAVHTPDGADLEGYYKAGKGPNGAEATFKIPGVPW